MSASTVLEHAENSPLALEILAYFRRNPKAKDSAEGVARWWVGGNPVDVCRVLERLVELNLVGKRSNTCCDFYFATNSDGSRD